MSMRLLRTLLLFGDPLDLLFPDFLHGQPGHLRAAFHLGRASRLELLGAGSRDGDEFELVHTVSFPVNDPTMRAMVEAITRGRARSASTIDRSRSTHAASSSLTMTYSYSATARTSRRAVARRLRIASSESLLRPRNRRSSASNEGGSTKMPIALAPCDRTWRAPWTSMTSTRSRPPVSSRSVSALPVP